MNPFVITHVLAPTDLSESSIPALRYARLFADRFGAKLTVLYSDPVIYPVDLAAATGPYLMPTVEHQANLRDEVIKHVSRVMTGRLYDVAVTIGHPASAILSEARDRKTDLIVTGTHLRHGWRRALLGSVSEGVLHGSKCPVLTVASREPLGSTGSHAVTNILCPINFTDVARRAVHAAARLAEAFSARLTVVHVLETDEVKSVPADEERVRRWVAPELQDVLSYRELVVRGGAAERVLDCAEDVGADLLVVGAQHKLFRDSTVIGTTSERLIRFASCPVLVVPRPIAEARREDACELTATSAS